MWTGDQQIDDWVSSAFRCLQVDPEPIKFMWSNHMTKSAGIAIPMHCISIEDKRPDLQKPGTIKLSRKLWDRATEEQRRTVVIHEVCHVVVERWCYAHRIRWNGHGFMWQRAMTACGLQPTPFHDIDVTGLAKGGYVHCRCQRAFASKKTLIRILQRGIYCSRCGVKITRDQIEMDTVRGINIEEVL